MLHRFVDLFSEALFVVFFLPLLAWYSIQDWMNARHRSLSRRRILTAGLFRQSVGEFNFEHAIEAYEELIDFTFAGGRP